MEIIMKTYKTMLLGAAAGAMMLLGAGGAWAQERCSGDKDGWTIIDQTAGGVETVTCYEEEDLVNARFDCSGNGNWIVVPEVLGASLTIANPGNQRFQCVTEEPGTCLISRAKGQGSINFDLCG